jgi:hypothetical protein
MEILFDGQRKLGLEVPERVKTIGDLLPHIASELLRGDEKKTTLFLSSDGSNM